MDLNLETILKQDLKVKIAILAGTLLLLVGVYVWVLLLPLNREIDSRQKRLAQLMDKKAEQEAIVQNLEAFKAECRNLEIQLKDALAQLPNRKEIPSLLQNLSNLGRTCGLEMPFFKPEAEMKRDFYAEVPVDIKLVGPYQNMLDFFYKAGRLPRIVTIENLTVQDAGASAPSGSLAATFMAVTFRFLEESERVKPVEGPKQGKKKAQTE